MPEVRCPQHGVFAYRSADCPGCANELAAEQHRRAGEARTFYDREYARLQSEIEEQRRQYVERLNVAQAHLDENDRFEALINRQVTLTQAADERDGSALARRAMLTAQLNHIKAELADFERGLEACNIGVRVMLTMIDTIREATELLIAEDKLMKRKQLEAQREESAIAAACHKLDRQYGGLHTMGLAGSEYENVILLGAVDIDRKRYARLQLYEGRWVCVPWIDAFAENVGGRISVVWNNNSTKERFRVSNLDGIIDEE